MSTDRLYTLMVVSKFGDPIAELGDAQLTSCTWELNGPGKIVYTLPQNSTNVETPVENVNEIQLWIDGYNDRLIQDGVIPSDVPAHWCFHHQTREQPRQIEFTCPGQLQYFAFKFITNTTKIFFWSSFVAKHTHSNDAYAGEQAQILAQLVQYFQDGTDQNVGIFLDTVPLTGIQRLRTYKREDHDNALKIMQDFCTLTDAAGNPTGMDFEVIYKPNSSGVPLKYFKIYYPQGNKFVDIVQLEWGKNITDYTVNKDGSQMANHVYMTGGSAGAVKFEQYYRDDDSASIYGEWQAIEQDGDEKDVPTLLERAQREVALRNSPVVTVDVTSVDVPEQLLGIVRVGDWVRVQIDNGRTHVLNYYRVQSITWLPGPGNLKYTLAQR